MVEKLIEIKQICKNCKWRKDGDCHLNPPLTFYVPETKTCHGHWETSYPNVRYDDYCSHFKYKG